MIKYFFCFSFVFYSLYSFAQKKITYPTIELGISHRNASIELSDYPIRTSRGFGFYYDQVLSTRSQSFSVDFRQKIFKEKIYLQFSTYYRYNHFRYESNSLSKEIKRFKSDLFLDGIYAFRKKKKTSFGFLLGCGFGYMNMGTKFTYNYNTGIKDTSGNWIIENRKSSFSFFAPRLIVGIQKNKLNGFVIVHGTPDDDYRSNPTLWIEFKVSYSIAPFRKKQLN